MDTTSSRRAFLTTLGLAAAAVRFPETAVSAMAADDPHALRGVFIILNTPFTSTGDVDWADLEREVAFVEQGGCAGIVWPQGSSGVATLTKDERLRGMEVLANAVKGRKLTLVLGVQGRDTAEMLDTRHARRRLAAPR
ncbi:MAG: dihydrodipicolinate synthase family protein [Vicinamibacterales bacterium]